jgi:uncharacterized protein YceK
MKRTLLFTLLIVILVFSGCKTVYVTETITTTQTATTTTTERITETATVINERNMLETLAYPCIVYSDVIVHSLGYYLMNNGIQESHCTRWRFLTPAGNHSHRYRNRN